MRNLGMMKFVMSAVASGNCEMVKQTPHQHLVVLAFIQPIQFAESYTSTMCLFSCWLPVHAKTVSVRKKASQKVNWILDFLAGMFGLSLLAMIPASHFKFQKVCLQFYSGISDKGIIATVFGGWMLGAGMVLSGSVIWNCPQLLFSAKFWRMSTSFWVVWREL